MIKEPEWENEYDAAQKLCPCCREGTLILIYNDINGKPVYGCTNYPYCEYTCSTLPKKSLWRKKFEKEDEFIQWLQNKGFANSTIDTYIVAVSKYTDFLQEDKTGKAWQKTAVISRKPSETAVKDKNDPYPNLKIGQIAQFKLIPLLESGQVDAAEIKRLTDSRYCKRKFDLDYPLLSKKRYDDLGYSHYYKSLIRINGEYFYVCSQWYETSANNDRPYLLRWMREYSVPESVEKNKNDLYPHLKIEHIVRFKLLPLLKSGRVVAAEIQELTDSQYCKQVFDLDYPLLSKSCRYDSQENPLYYKDSIWIKGEKFYVCSKWSETHVNNNRPYLLRWLQEYSVPETVQSSPSSDTDIIAASAESTSPETVSVGVSSKIAAPAESTGPETVSVGVSSKIAARTESTSPKTFFVNVNSRVAAPAEKANPEPVQAEQHDDSHTADLLFLEDAMKRIKECIARNGDVLSVKCARGYTPLMVAARCDDADVLAVIIARMKEANGNFEQRNDEGKTAYIVARESRAEKAMSLLKEAGARTDAAIIIARRKISAAEQNNCEKK